MYSVSNWKNEGIYLFKYMHLFGIELLLSIIYKLSELSAREYANEQLFELFCFRKEEILLVNEEDYRERSNSNELDG